MNENRYGSYVVLALVIAATAIIANAAQTVQIMQDFDPSGSTQATYIGFWFAQASTAMAMVCAILLGRTWFARGASLQDSAVMQGSAAMQDVVGDSSERSTPEQL